MIAAIIILIIIIVWFFYDRLAIRWNSYQARRAITAQENDITALWEHLKSKTTAIDNCKKDPASCPTVDSQNQLAMLSAGLGDHRSEISHVTNALTDLRRNIDTREMEICALLNTRALTLEEKAAFDKFMEDVKVRLAELKKRIDAIKDIV